MDEPLSNLDAKLRVQMRAEISRIQADLGTTTIYVTHDQVEAMTMGDRVAVIKQGRLQQVDTPQVLYDEPVNLFVGGFIGSPSMNMVEATVERDDDGVWVAFGGIRLRMPDEVASKRPGLARFEGRDGRRSGSDPRTSRTPRSRAMRRTTGASARRSTFAKPWAPRCWCISASRRRRS